MYVLCTMEFVLRNIGHWNRSEKQVIALPKNCQLIFTKRQKLLIEEGDTFLQTGSEITGHP